MSNPPRGAFIQRDKKSYAIVPRISAGLVTPDFLENVARVARKYNVPLIKLTSAQRLALVGLNPEDVEKIWQELGADVGPAVGPCVHYVKACPGTAACRFGILDSLGLGLRLEKEFLGMDLPAKVKIGVSGCPNKCGEAYVRDIGLFGKKSGWTFIFSGNSGARPRIGDIIAENLTDDQVVELARKCLDYYKANARGRERTARFIERIGIEEFKKAVL
jgi:NAD(P)H-nitrite reductase large subunit